MVECWGYSVALGILVVLGYSVVLGIIRSLVEY